MGDHPTTILSLRARIRDLEAVIDSLEHDNLDLIDKVAKLEAELARREQDSWRPHR